MEIKVLTENKDGSATVVVDLDSTELQALVQVGMTKILTDYIAQDEEERRREAEIQNSWSA